MTFQELFAADVRIERDIPYLQQGGSPRHRLDVYSPVEASNVPVVFFFYGGGWRSGDKRLFEHLGRAFAVRGMVAVTVNYRLTPAVRHPAHVEDCAAAVAWGRKHIAEYGGDPDMLFLTGHSAGGHLALLLGTDHSYLNHNGVPESAIKGVVSISGVADLDDHSDSSAFTSPEHIAEAFGSTSEELNAASPIKHLRTGLPPFLVIVAEDDPAGLREQGRRFADGLRDMDGDVVFISVKERDHISIVRRFGPSDDTTVNAITDFIFHYANHSAKA